MQNIAYGEFLPTVLGVDFMKTYGLIVSETSEYDPKIGIKLKQIDIKTCYDCNFLLFQTRPFSMPLHQLLSDLAILWSMACSSWCLKETPEVAVQITKKFTGCGGCEKSLMANLFVENNCRWKT